MPKPRRRLWWVAGAALVVAALAVKLVSTQRVRDLIKSSPELRRINSSPLRQVDAWIYNLRHRTPPPSELGDGRSTEEILLSDPMGVALGDSGAIYVADRGGLGPGHVVWAIGRGTARIIAGTGRRGIARAGIPARRSDLGSPQGLCVDAEGRVYVADSYNHAVFRIELDGQLTRIAGIGRPGDEGDGGPAVKAALNQPYDVRVDEGGNVYIADYGNHRIRSVSVDGRIHTVAGTGEAGYSGDGGPAVSARLRGPYGVYPDPRYGLLIADSENHVLRQVDRDGRIHTLAGTGTRGNAGDDGPAARAQFDTPQSIAVDPDGRIFIGDEHNHEIRMIDAGGVLHRILGSGKAGFSSDGTPASAVELNDPENMVLFPDGALLWTEAGNGRLRLLRPDGRLSTLAGGHS